MKETLLEIFHTFLIAMVYLLVIGGGIILAGRYDTWTSRLYFWRRKKRPNANRFN